MALGGGLVVKGYEKVKNVCGDLNGYFQTKISSQNDASLVDLIPDPDSNDD